MITPNPKYKTYGELAAAFKSGELDEHYVLTLDKGGTQNSLSYRDSSLSDAEYERKSDECGALFNGDLVEIEGIFAAAGIPTEWC